MEHQIWIRADTFDYHLQITILWSPSCSYESFPGRIFRIPWVYSLHCSPSLDYQRLQHSYRCYWWSWCAQTTWPTREHWAWATCYCSNSYHIVPLFHGLTISSQVTYQSTVSSRLSSFLLKDHKFPSGKWSQSVLIFCRMSFLALISVRTSSHMTVKAFLNAIVIHSCQSLTTPCTFDH